MDTVLVVEDMKLFGNMLVREIRKHTPFDVVWTQSLAETREILDNQEHDFFLALLDLTLPDAMDGEIVDLAISRGLTSIVFTATLEEAVREDMWTKNIADYVCKDHAHNLEYILRTVKRIHENASITILVVDDSAAQRHHMMRLLEIHRYQVLEATNGIQALEVIQRHPEISLVITDFHMPRMDGQKLTRKIRETYSREEMSIIGISSIDNRLLSASFIKSGANDFLNKPFISDEFYCRVGMNVEMLLNVAKIRDASNKDFLTGLWNRRYFFEWGQDLFQQALVDSDQLFVAMLDIDHFKKINDNHGHDVGDVVLKRLARLLKTTFRDEMVVARFGGEEFCVLGKGQNPGQLFELFDGFRIQVESTPVHTNTEDVFLTISIGVCPVRKDTLHQMLVLADECLYQAKNQGRNQVVSAS